MDTRLLLTSVLAAFALAAQGVSAYTLDEVIAEALQSSPEVSAAAESATDAAEAIGSPFSFDSSRLSVTGNYRQDDRDTAFGGGASVSIPVVPQLSLGGNVSVPGSSADFDGWVSVSLHPFAAPKTFAAETGTYEIALIQLDYRIREVEAQAESTAIGWVVASRRVSHAEETLVLREDEYEVMQQTYNLGEATYEELQESQRAVSAARRQYLSAQTNLISAAKSLALLLGPSVDRSAGLLAATVEAPTLDELLARVETRARMVETADLSIASDPTDVSSRDIETMQVNLRTLETELGATWAWRPSLSLDSSYVLGSGSISASVSLSISAADFGSERREDILSDIADAEESLQSEEFAVALDREAARQSVSLSREALDASLIDLEQAEILVQESELLARQGERTTLELRDAKIALSVAETAVLEALQAVLEAQSEYLLYVRQDR